MSRPSSSSGSPSSSLAKEIDPERSSWSFASVGRISITLAKVEVVTWPTLLAKGETKPKNMHSWYERQTVLDDEVKSFCDDTTDKVWSGWVDAVSKATTTDFTFCKLRRGTTWVATYVGEGCKLELVLPKAKGGAPVWLLPDNKSYTLSRYISK